MGINLEEVLFKDVVNLVGGKEHPHDVMLAYKTYDTYINKRKEFGFPYNEDLKRGADIYYNDWFLFKKPKLDKLYGQGYDVKGLLNGKKGCSKR